MKKSLLILLLLNFAHFNLNAQETNNNSENQENSERQRIYFKGIFSPTIDMQPVGFNESGDLDFLLDDLQYTATGEVPLTSGFFDNIETGIGYKATNNISFEGVFKLTKFHVGLPDVHSVEFSSGSDVGIGIGSDSEVLEFEPRYLGLFNFIDNSSILGSLDTLGIMGKGLYQKSLFDDDSYVYFGFGYGLFAANVPVNDWSHIWSGEAGILIEFTDFTDIKLGYEYTRYAETQNGIVALEGFDRHSVVLGFHLYKTR